VRALAAVAGALPNVTALEATDADGVAEGVRALARPAVLLAQIDEPAWPGPSPFVDPHRVRARFAANARGVS